MSKYADPTETHYAGDEDDDDYAQEEDDWDEAEHALEECGQVPGMGCQLAGTEFCDFDCPYRDIDLFADNAKEEQ